MNFCHRAIRNRFSFLTASTLSLSILLFAFASIANAAPKIKLCLRTSPRSTQAWVKNLVLELPPAAQLSAAAMLFLV